MQPSFSVQTANPSVPYCWVQITGLLSQTLNCSDFSRSPVFCFYLLFFYVCDFVQQTKLLFSALMIGFHFTLLFHSCQIPGETAAKRTTLQNWQIERNIRRHQPTALLSMLLPCVKMQ